MKSILKSVSIIFLLSLFLVSFSSCKPRPLAIEKVVNISIDYMDTEMMKQLENYVPPAEKTFTFRGREYKLEYKWPEFNPYEHRTYYEYWEMDGLKKGVFTFDMNGKLGRAYLHSPTTFEKKVTADYCIPQAKKIFSEYLDDITQYRITTSEYTGGYIVKFTKYVDDIETVDCARIGFDYDGEFISLNFNSLNKIPADLDTNLFDMKAIKKALFDQVKKDFSGDGDEPTNDQISIKEYSLVRGYDGQYGFHYIVRVYEHTLKNYLVFLENRFPLS